MAQSVVIVLALFAEFCKSVPATFETPKLKISITPSWVMTTGCASKSKHTKLQSTGSKESEREREKDAERGGKEKYSDGGAEIWKPWDKLYGVKRRNTTSVWRGHRHTELKRFPCALKRVTKDLPLGIFHNRVYTIFTFFLILSFLRQLSLSVIF